MDKREHKEKNYNISKYFDKTYDVIKQEDYKIFVKDKNISSSTKESLLHKKRNIPRNEESRKKIFIKKESTKFSHQNKYIKAERKKNSENEEPEESQELKLEKMKKEFEEKLFELKVENSIFKHQLEEYKRESFMSQQKLDNLLTKINSLDAQVEELNDFYFQARLRKLLKNLIQYIFDNFYPDYMHFNRMTKKMEFLRAPLFTYKLISMGEYKIINVLNRLLDTIFMGAKINDYAVHFVEPKAENNINFRRYIKVFNDHRDFFKYFNFNEIDSSILIQIIPRQYFIQIDNFKFEISIKELMKQFEYNSF